MARESEQRREMIEIKWEGETIACTVIYSSRRTMAVSVSKEAEVILRLPDRVSAREGQRFAQEHARWIYEHINQARERVKGREAFCFVDGAVLDFHGEARRLTVVNEAGGAGKVVKSRLSAAAAGEQCGRRASRIRVWEEDGKILVAGASSEAAVEDAVKVWYKSEARSFLIRRTQFWAQAMGVGYRSISVRDQASRWGSCSGKGNLNYNWRLVLLPRELADYVVVHELAHRRQMNHSDQFWQVVGEMLPDYLERRRRLKEYEIQINSKY